jgi:hypothetical protein
LIVLGRLKPVVNTLPPVILFQHIVLWVTEVTPYFLVTLDRLYR